MSKLEVLTNGKEPTKTKPFKTLTCVLKEEEALISNSGQDLGKRRYQFSFKTHANDVGFGESTGDMITVLSLVTTDSERFKTGKKYQVSIDEV